MIKFDKFEQGKALAQGGGTTSVWYAKAVQLYAMSTNAFVDNIANLGSSAYSRGELRGVALDLGRAIAQMMINGNKVKIDGLGTFTPTIRNDKKNLKNSDEVRKSDLYVVATFTPDEDFTSILLKAEFDQVSKGSSADDSGASYTMAYSNPSDGVLRFIPSEPALLAEITAADVTCKLNGTAAGNITVGEDYIDVTGLNAGTYNVELSVRATVTYNAYKKSWTNVQISGSVAPQPGSTYDLDAPTEVTRGVRLKIGTSPAGAWDSWNDLSNVNSIRWKLNSNSNWNNFASSSYELITEGGHKKISISTAAVSVGDIDFELSIKAFGSYEATTEIVTVEVTSDEVGD